MENTNNNKKQYSCPDCKSSRMYYLVLTPRDYSDSLRGVLKGRPCYMCENPSSEHYQHIVGSDHPICSEVITREKNNNATNR